MNQKLLYFLLFLSLGTLIIFWASFKYSKKVTPKLAEKNFKKVSPSPTPAWSQHQDFKYGFQIEYPFDWSKEEWEIGQAANLKTLPEGYIWHQLRLTKGNGWRLEVVLWANKAQTPLLTWLLWYRHEDLPPEKLPKELNYQILGRPALFLFQEESSHDKHPVIRIFFQKEDKVFEFVAQNQTVTLDPLYQQIIASFKFL